MAKDLCRLQQLIKIGTQEKGEKKKTGKHSNTAAGVSPRQQKKSTRGWIVPKDTINNEEGEQSKNKNKKKRTTPVMLKKKKKKKKKISSAPIQEGSNPRQVTVYGKN